MADSLFGGIWIIPIRNVTQFGVPLQQTPNRFKQFDNTIIRKTGHGGADRFRYKYEDYQDLVYRLFISVCSVECNVKSNSPKDLRIMGEVAKFEYDCLANYVKKFGNLPEFNDKRKSPKYSLTHK